MKCKNCGKGRPKLWTKEGGFCNDVCLTAWQARVKNTVEMLLGVATELLRNE